MTKWLLERALARLPEPLRERYAAEWSADLAQLHGLAALRWALGLQRASSELRGDRVSVVLSLLVLKAGVLGLAYYAAFLLRFGRDIPPIYADLLTHTLPFAVAGGLVCLALTTNVVKGVALSTLTLVAYVAMIQPVLVLNPRGLRALTLPVGVVVLYALSAGAALLALSYANDWARARSTATR